MNIVKQVLSGLILLSYAFSSYATDQRQVIWVSAEEKSALLAEMRGFLVASQAVLHASLSEDMQVVEQAARPVGVKALKSTPEAILKKLPAGFTAIGPRVHQAFEVIADEATGLGDRQIILETLADLQTHCIACHAAYRFEVVKAP